MLARHIDRDSAARSVCDMTCSLVILIVTARPGVSVTCSQDVTSETDRTNRQSERRTDFTHTHTHTCSLGVGAWLVVSEFRPPFLCPFYDESNGVFMMKPV